MSLYFLINKQFFIILAFFEGEDGSDVGDEFMLLVEDLDPLVLVVHGEVVDGF